MNLPRFAINNKIFIHFITFLIFVGGIHSFTSLGQLEDPDFTVKTAVVVTQYPGATPEEVELEVTDLLETAIQELPQLKKITSYSRAGLSIIKVEIKQEYWADRLPQVWDELRRKVHDAEPRLPPGALAPDVGDDYSFVFGFVLAITGDGYTYAELENYAKAVRKELSLVPGVSRADLWGVQPRVIYLDLRETQIAELGISKGDIFATLSNQNIVVDSGSLEVPGKRMRIETTGEFETPSDIGELVVVTASNGLLANASEAIAPYGRDIASTLPLGSSSSSSTSRSSSGEIIRIKDIATVREGYLDPPLNMMRFNGEPALAIQIANVAGGNVVETGKALDARLAELEPFLPAGIVVEKFSWQSDLVDESIGGFLINLAEAVVIVLLVLTLAMGWRQGLIIGWALVLTIAGTFIVMVLLGIDLHRVSLGALVIALGMMVDNAIVVADGAQVGMENGKSPEDAAIESASKPSIALLGATIVAAMAFFPIYLAKTDSGEYAGSLFVVVAVSLLWSWLIAMLVTPLNCISLLKPSKKKATAEEGMPSAGFFGFYRRTLEAAIRMRVLTIGGLAALLIAAAIGFGGVPQQFFPESTRSQFRIDYWAEQGTPIGVVSEVVRKIEERVSADPRVAGYATFIGQGGPRFYLPVDPEFPTPEYSQVVVAAQDYQGVVELMAELEPWLRETFNEGMIRVRKYAVGPGNEWPFEVRFSGPAEADMAVLRSLVDQGMAILEDSPYAKDVRTDIRQRVQKVVVDFDQTRARWSGISRSDVATATKRGYDGAAIGIYRDGDTLYPIIARDDEASRSTLAGSLELLQVKSPLATKSLPLGQVTEEVAVAWEDPIIVRVQRRRAASVQATPTNGTFPNLRADVIDEFEAIELPNGYEMFWGGEYDSSTTAQAGLVPGIVPALVIMAAIMVALFNALRPPIVIVLTVPFAIIGITAVLLVTQTPFGFMAILGAMSLMGLMIKNSIVLIDEINLNKSNGMQPYDAVVAAGLSRVRPVALGAATTILGVMPLLQDAFWISMALTMMAGLTLGTVLTVVMIPVLYATLYRIPSPAKTAAS